MEILNKTPILVPALPKSILIFSLILFIISVLGAIVLAFDDSKSALALIIITGIVAAGTTNAYDHIEKKSGRYQYEVILDEDYKFIELYNKYNVIERRGEIWVLEDKEIDK